MIHTHLAIHFETILLSFLPFFLPSSPAKAPPTIRPLRDKRQQLHPIIPRPTRAPGEKK